MAQTLIRIELLLNEHSTKADIQEIRPYIERMVSFSVDSPSKWWRTDIPSDADGYEEHSFIVEDANLRKLFIQNKSDDYNRNLE